MDENNAVFIPRVKADYNRQAFCNYLVLEVEGVEEKDFQTSRKESVKFLSNIQSRADKHGRQVQQFQPQTLSQSLSTT